LGATKVNSLVDAFNKPFMVGGLKREDGTVRPASDLTASKGVSTTERVNAQAGSSNGNGPANVPGEQEVESEPVGSPDWPSDVEVEDDEDEDERPVARGREKVPSRSASPGPETNGDAEVWRDPLEDDEDEETAAPASKRRRES